jgi:hypothetical protein
MKERQSLISEYAIFFHSGVMPLITLAGSGVIHVLSKHSSNGWAEMGTT